MHSIRLDAPFTDTDAPLLWWHIKVFIEKKRWWQQNIIKSCEARLTQYGDNGKPRAEYALLWRTSQGPKKVIDLKIAEPPAILCLAARQTSGEDMAINPDPINLPSINVPSHSAIITDEVAIYERRFSIMPIGMHPLGLKIYHNGGPITDEKFFWLYVPEIKYDNAQFKCLTTDQL